MSRFSVGLTIALFSYIFVCTPTAKASSLRCDEASSYIFDCTQSAPGNNREVFGVAELRAELRSGSGSPTQSLLTAIVKWLSTNFDLPAIYDHPRIELVAAATIGALHYKNFLPTERFGFAAANDPAVQSDQLKNVVAIYDSVTKTIYLPVGWRGATPAELSVLVHEMIHHLQKMAGLKFECPQAREKVAFLAQERWLHMFGSDLANEFGIDPFTLLVKTNCAY